MACCRRQPVGAKALCSVFWRRTGDLFAGRLTRLALGDHPADLGEFELARVDENAALRLANAMSVSQAGEGDAKTADVRESFLINDFEVNGNRQIPAVRTNQMLIEESDRRSARHVVLKTQGHVWTYLLE